MNENQEMLLNISKRLNFITRTLINKYHKFGNKHHVKELEKVMKNNKPNLRENVRRKIKRLKNILKSTRQVNPCLLAALAEQERCILNEGNLGNTTVKIFDAACTPNSVQNVIQNWNPDPTTHYDLYESDPDYEEKKRKRDEGEGIGWYSTISGCGQTVHNKLLDTSSLKDRRSEEKERERRAKLSDEQRQIEDQQLAEFYRKYEQNKNKSDEQNKNKSDERYETEQEIVIGGKSKKKKKKTRRKKNKRKKKKKTRRKK